MPHKRLEQAVDVVVALTARHPGVAPADHRCGLVGAELRRYVESRSASDLVDLLGRLDADERDRETASATAMLLPSVREGWGLAVIEAALQGTPSVAYRSAGGVCESVRHDETGLLVDSPTELRDAVDRLLGDPALHARLSGACRDWALTFDWDEAAAAVETLLEARRRDQVAG